MVLLPDIGYPQTGEIADPGTYACLNCPHDSNEDETIAILDKRKALPKCPVCGITYWMRI